MPCCEISDCAQMSKTIIAVRHFELGGRESLETAVNISRLLPTLFKNFFLIRNYYAAANNVNELIIFQPFFKNLFLQLFSQF